MNYIDGFVVAGPNANKQKYIEHAERAGAIFREYGALKSVECRGDDVPDGEFTSLPMAVPCRDDKTVCFSWIVWPSREIRNEAMQKAMADERLDPNNHPMPFDGMRLIYGGFGMIVDT